MYPSAPRWCRRPHFLAAYSRPSGRFPRGASHVGRRVAIGEALRADHAPENLGGDGRGGVVGGGQSYGSSLLGGGRGGRGRGGGRPGGRRRSRSAKIAPDLVAALAGQGARGSVQRAASGKHRALVGGYGGRRSIVARSIFRRPCRRPRRLARARPPKPPSSPACSAGRLTRNVALVLLASAFVDLVLTRRAWNLRLRMSKDEVKREARESEGDPHLEGGARTGAPRGVGAGLASTP